MRAIRQQRLADDRAERDAKHARGKGGNDDLQREYANDLGRHEADRLHDSDLAVGGDHDSGHERGHDREGCRQGEDAERAQDSGEDLVGDVEDVADEDVVEGARDASRRQGRSQAVGVALKLCPGRIGGEPVVHQVVRRIRRGQRRYRSGLHPGPLTAEVSAALIDVDHLADHVQQWRLYDARDLHAVANRDAVEVGERPSQNDLVVGLCPSPGRDVENLDIPQRVVSAHRVDEKLLFLELELDGGYGVGTTERRGSDRCRRR